MSLESSRDARRVAALMRAEHQGLDAYLDTLSPDDWKGPSFASDWKVYQVVSHLGSGPEINNGTLRHVLFGDPEITDEQRRAIWGRFDSLAPDEVHAAFRETNDRMFATLTSLTDDQLAAQVPWFGGGTAPLAMLLAARLSEQTLHTWDIRVMKNPAATLTPDNVPDVLEFLAGRIDVFVRPELAGPLGDKTIQFDLSDPQATVALSLTEGGPPSVTAGPVSNPDLRVATSAETFIRLVWGRYRAPASPARLELDQPELQPHLIAAFPGR
jgi:uncharacterized protein (TIGR03083 family)